MSAQPLQLQRACLPLFFAIGLLAGCSEKQAPDDALSAIKAPEIARIVPAKEALSGALIPTLDPATMHEAEIRKALETGRWCTFRYTSAGKPVLAFTLQQNGQAGVGVVKLNGHLVVLETESSTAVADAKGEFVLRADPVQMTVVPDAGERSLGDTNERHKEANARFEVGQELRVGYRGYLECRAEPATKSGT